MSQEKKASNRISTCKSDLNFKVTYANNEFVKETGYSLADMINESITIFRHPKMPLTIPRQVKINITKGLNYNVISLEITKKGATHWVANNVTIDKDSVGNTIGYTNKRKLVPQDVIKKIKPFYDDLYKIEKSEGKIAANFYFHGYLAGKSQLYQDYIVSLFDEETELKKSIGKKTLDWFFNTEYISR